MKRSVVAVALLVIVFNLMLLALRVSHPQPSTPWESGIVLDAWRANAGLPVYEYPSVGHATTMYGPLTVYALAAIFKVSGPSNRTARLVQIVCGLLAVGILAFVLAPRSLTAFLIALAILLGVNLRTGLYFADARPDAASLLFLVLALVLCYQKQWRYYILGLFCLLVSFYFKQTAIVGALILFLAFVITQESYWKTKAVLPIVMLCAAMFLTWLLWPMVFHYMITIPALNPIVEYRLIKAPLDLLAALPIVFLAFAHFLISREKTTRLARWLFVSIGVTLFYGTLSASRIGGSINSFMPALAAMFAFVVWRLSCVLKTTQSALVTLMVATTLVSLFAYPQYVAGALTETHGDENYNQVIEMVKGLDGVTVCPNDPTIPFYANGQVGRQLYMEMDAVGIWQPIPEYVLDEMRRADHVVQVDPVFGHQFLSNEQLEALGYQQIRTDAAYSLWSKVSHTTKR